MKIQLSEQKSWKEKGYEEYGDLESYVGIW